MISHRKSSFASAICCEIRTEWNCIRVIAAHHVVVLVLQVQVLRHRVLPLLELSHNRIDDAGIVLFGRIGHLNERRVNVTHLGVQRLRGGLLLLHTVKHIAEDLVLRLDVIVEIFELLALIVGTRVIGSRRILPAARNLLHRFVVLALQILHELGIGLIVIICNSHNDSFMLRKEDILCRVNYLAEYTLWCLVSINRRSREETEGSRQTRS